MGKSTAKTQTPRKKAAKRISAEQAFEKEIKQQQAVIQKHNRELSKRRKALLKKLDIEEVILATNAEKKMYDAVFKDFKSDTKRLDQLKAIAGKISRDQLIKKYPAIRRIIEFNREGKRQLSKLLHPTGANVFDPHSVLNPDVATAELSEFDIFEPPFAFPRNMTTSAFDDDYSFTLPQWGLLGTHFKFRHSDWGSVFGGTSSEHSNRWVGFGLDYRTKKSGRMEIYFQLRALTYNVDFSISDNVWFSHGHFNFKHEFSITASTVALPTYHEQVAFIDADRSSDGDYVNTPPIEMSVPTDGPVFVKLTTDDLGAGYRFEIRIRAESSINSHLSNMDTAVDANILWLVERVYVRVVE
jgi:hypothetical protein